MIFGMRYSIIYISTFFFMIRSVITLLFHFRCYRMRLMLSLIAPPSIFKMSQIIYFRHVLLYFYFSSSSVISGAEWYAGLRDEYRAPTASLANAITRHAA